MKILTTIIRVVETVLLYFLLGFVTAIRLVLALVLFLTVMIANTLICILWQKWIPYRTALGHIFIYGWFKDIVLAWPVGPICQRLYRLWN